MITYSRPTHRLASLSIAINKWHSNEKKNYATFSSPSYLPIHFLLFPLSRSPSLYPNTSFVLAIYLLLSRIYTWNMNFHMALNITTSPHQQDWRRRKEKVVKRGHKMDDYPTVGKNVAWGTYQGLIISLAFQATIDPSGIQSQVRFSLSVR